MVNCVVTSPRLNLRIQQSQRASGALRPEYGALAPAMGDPIAGLLMLKPAKSDILLGIDRVGVPTACYVSNNV